MNTDLSPESNPTSSHEADAILTAALAKTKAVAEGAGLMWHDINHLQGAMIWMAQHELVDRVASVSWVVADCRGGNGKHVLNGDLLVMEHDKRCCLVDGTLGNFPDLIEQHEQRLYGELASERLGSQTFLERERNDLRDWSGLYASEIEQMGQAWIVMEAENQAEKLRHGTAGARKAGLRRNGL